MPPPLALVLCLGFIATLLILDVRRTTGVSKALWIPLAWMMIICSRSVTEWWHLGSPLAVSSPDAFIEGSPIDRNVLLLLIILGCVVVFRRSTSLVAVARRNPWIVLYLGFGLISVVWSDYPFTAFKRWYKVAGHAVMVLVILTEAVPARAFIALFRRCAYVLTPLSVLFIKYYPELGRTFSFWTGAASNTGVTTNRNLLANYCFFMILFFATLLVVRPGTDARGHKWDRYVCLLFLYLNGWLLYMAGSATSAVCAAVSIVVMMLLRAPRVERHFTAVLVSTILVVGVLHLTGVGIMELATSALNRESTLTGRTDLWEELGTIENNALVGVGFESFWLGERAAEMWERHWWKPNQAHNGYFETYLTLGAVGLVLQCVAMVAAYLYARRALKYAMSIGADEQIAMALFSVGFVVAFAFYNITEAAFKSLHPSFFVFFVVSICCAQLERSSALKPISVMPRHPAGCGRTRAPTGRGRSVATAHRRQEMSAHRAGS